MDRSLEQSPTKAPFPREFVAFTQIASRTSQYDIIDTISGNIRAHHSAQRESVFYVIDILAFNLLKSLLAIVALTLLSLQLLSNLLRCMGAANTLLTSPIGTLYRAIQRLILLIMELMSSPCMFFVRLIVALTSLRLSFFINLIVNLVVLFMLFFVSVIPSFFTYKTLFSNFGTHTVFFASLAFALLALIIKSLEFRFAMMEVLFSQRINIPTCRTSPIPICCFFRRLYAKVFASSASFANGKEAVFGRFVLVEVSGRCWKLILAPGASFLRNCLTSEYRNVFNRLTVERVKIECALSEVFWYTGIHSRNQTFLLSRLGMLVASLRQNIIQFNLLNYIINPLQKQCEEAL